jgi:hypothetical protein
MQPNQDSDQTDLFISHPTTFAVCAIINLPTKQSYCLIMYMTTYDKCMKHAHIQQSSWEPLNSKQQSVGLSQ